MCLIVFGWGLEGRFPVVVAANRDEFHARPTAAARWSDDGRRLAGRDLRGGGTWMGVTRDGRFAALTNHRDPASVRPDVPSRGVLCDQVLAAAATWPATLDDMARTACRFNGFNLLAGRWDAAGKPLALQVVDESRDRFEDVAPGVHGLSNARLDTPWPKVERGRTALAAALADEPQADLLVDRLFAMLGDDSTAPDADLPATGVAVELERALSAAFIRLPTYGTRSSTVMLVEDGGRVTVVERNDRPDTRDAPVAETRQVFATVDASAARAS